MRPAPSATKEVSDGTRYGKSVRAGPRDGTGAATSTTAREGSSSLGGVGRIGPARSCRSSARQRRGGGGGSNQRSELQPLEPDRARTGRRGNSAGATSGGKLRLLRRLRERNRSGPFGSDAERATLHRVPGEMGTPSACRRNAPSLVCSSVAARGRDHDLNPAIAGASVLGIVAVNRTRRSKTA